MSKQTEALRLYFTANGIKLKDVADRLGLPNPCVISNMLAGRDALGSKRAKQLADAYGFSYMFLMTGEGDLLQDDRLISHPVSQTANVRTNNGSISQSAACPSVEDLMARIEELKTQVENERKEKAWMQSLIDKLTAAH